MNFGGVREYPRGQTSSLLDQAAIMIFLVLRLLTALLLPPLFLSWCVDLLRPRPTAIIIPNTD